MGFGENLKGKIEATGRALCVGIDPSSQLVADYSPAGIEKFGLQVIDSCAGLVPAVKPQSAFFEVFGSAGIEVLEKITHYAHEKGLLVILDVKRGDIGSTMAGYANAYLAANSPVYADAITLSPFLGFESLRPAIDLAETNDKGLFILVRTSNPEGLEVQGATVAGNESTVSEQPPCHPEHSPCHPEFISGSTKNNRVTSNGLTVSEMLVKHISQCNQNKTPVGNIGAVIGTTSAIDFDISNLNGYILAPGIGAQGGMAFDNVPNVLYSASRSITADVNKVAEAIKATHV